MQKIIPQSQLPNLIQSWMKKFDVVAPVKEGNTKFKKINSPDQIYMHALTEVTAKSHFIPDQEELLKFDGDKIIENEGKIKKTVLFGMRKCDMNAIQILDRVMYDKPYLNKRKNTFLVGLFCSNPDKFCFCNSMELTDYHDIFLYPKGKNYVIDVRTKKGEKLVKGLPDLKKEITIPNPKNFKKLNTHNIEGYYKNDLWKSDAKKCLSCSACTAYCPTCNCMDVKDVVDLKGKGSRIRYHLSCMLKSFSRVAGGKSYRESRLARFKHFVYHKIVYFKKHQKRSMCVGCGRCLRVCPTKIDWVKTINTMSAKV